MKMPTPKNSPLQSLFKGLFLAFLVSWTPAAPCKVGTAQVSGPAVVPVGSETIFKVQVNEEGTFILGLVGKNGIDFTYFEAKKSEFPTNVDYVIVYEDSEERSVNGGRLLNDGRLGTSLSARKWRLLDKTLLPQVTYPTPLLLGVKDKQVVWTKEVYSTVEEFLAVLPKKEEVLTAEQFLIPEEQPKLAGEEFPESDIFPFGCLEQQKPKNLSAPAGALPVLPRSEWLPTNRRHLVWYIFDQIDGMCTSNATAQCIMIQRELQGLEKVVLSPENLYGQHSRWGTGSTLWENLRAAMDVGVASREVVSQGDWRPSAWPDNWKDDAKKYRILKYYDLEGNFDKVASAIQLGYCVNIGITWPGGGGHSIVALDLVSLDNDKWGVGIINSWGSNWGDSGYGVLTESQVRTMGRYGAWCCFVVSIPEEEKVELKVASTEQQDSYLTVSP